MVDVTQQEIKAVVENYLKAIKTGDVNLFRRVFHPQALIVYPEDPRKPPNVSSLESFAKGAAQSISEQGKVEEIPRNLKIQNYRNIGAVRIDFDLTIGDSVYEGTDFFNLAKTEGKWVIMQKVYDMVLKTSSRVAR
jgi:hypothetical protein